MRRYGGVERWASNTKHWKQTTLTTHVRLSVEQTTRYPNRQIYVHNKTNCTIRKFAWHYQFIYVSFLHVGCIFAFQAYKYVYIGLVFKTVKPISIAMPVRGLQGYQHLVLMVSSLRSSMPGFISSRRSPRLRPLETRPIRLSTAATPPAAP